MKAHFLCRREDVSGTRPVAQAVEFDDGTVVVRWIAAMNAVGVASTTVFNSVDDLLKVHGHQGKTGLDLLLDSRQMEALQAEVEALRTELRVMRGGASDGNRP
jgi:hypothetical protein